MYVSLSHSTAGVPELTHLSRLFLRAYDKLAHTAQLRQGYNDLWWVLSEWAVTLRAHAARKMSEGTTMLVANAKGTGRCLLECLLFPVTLADARLL